MPANSEMASATSNVSVRRPRATEVRDARSANAVRVCIVGSTSGGVMGKLTGGLPSVQSPVVPQYRLHTAEPLNDAIGYPLLKSFDAWASDLFAGYQQGRYSVLCRTQFQLESN